MWHVIGRHWRLQLVRGGLGWTTQHHSCGHNNSQPRFRQMDCLIKLWPWTNIGIFKQWLLQCSWDYIQCVRTVATLSDRYPDARSILDFEAAILDRMPLPGTELEDIEPCAQYRDVIPAPGTVTLHCTAAAQFVLVRSMTSPVLVLCEVEVFGEAAGNAESDMTSTAASRMLVSSSSTYGKMASQNSCKCDDDRFVTNHEAPTQLPFTAKNLHSHTSFCFIIVNQTVYMWIYLSWFVALYFGYMLSMYCMTMRKGSCKFSGVIEFFLILSWY